MHRSGGGQNFWEVHSSVIQQRINQGQYLVATLYIRQTTVTRRIKEKQQLWQKVEVGYLW